MRSETKQFLVKLALLVVVLPLGVIWLGTIVFEDPLLELMGRPYEETDVRWCLTLPTHLEREWEISTNGMVAIAGNSVVIHRQEGRHHYCTYTGLVDHVGNRSREGVQ